MYTQYTSKEFPGVQMGFVWSNGAETGVDFVKAGDADEYVGSFRSETKKGQDR